MDALGQIKKLLRYSYARQAGGTSASETYPDYVMFNGVSRIPVSPITNSYTKEGLKRLFCHALNSILIKQRVPTITGRDWDMSPEYMTAYARMFPDPDVRLVDLAEYAHISGQHQAFFPEPDLPSAGVPVLNAEELRFETSLLDFGHQAHDAASALAAGDGGVDEIRGLLAPIADVPKRMRRLELSLHPLLVYRPEDGEYMDMLNGFRLAPAAPPQTHRLAACGWPGSRSVLIMGSLGDRSSPNDSSGLSQ